MANPNSDGEAVAGAMYRKRNAKYVSEYVKEPLEGVIRYEGERAFLAASDDLLILLVFTYIDLLGYLYKGNNSSANAVEFMRKYLGRIDARYEEVSGLLYHMLRHGYIHLATPKRIKLQDGKILDFLFVRSGQREDYLKIDKYQETQRTGDMVNIYRLALDIPLLYRDSLSAIDKYIEDIRDNQELSDTFWGAFKTRRSPQKEKEEKLVSRPYIQDTDFTFVREQISRL